jgi:hypothetical protein
MDEDWEEELWEEVAWWLLYENTWDWLGGWW